MPVWRCRRRHRWLMDGAGDIFTSLKGHHHSSVVSVRWTAAAAAARAEDDSRAGPGDSDAAAGQAPTAQPHSCWAETRHKDTHQ